MPNLLAGLISDGIKAAFDGLVDALEAAVSALISAWPFDMPELPSLPSEFLEAIAWIKWSPLPVAAGLALLMFLISVEIVWQLAKPLLRWAKVVGDDA